jgi:Arm DNA-binding domain
MRESNKLNAAFIRSIDLSKPKLYADGHNLYLQVSQYRTLSWLFRYMRDGVPRSMGLGPFHTVSLAEARMRARKERQKLLDDIDPLDVRRTERAKLKLKAAKAITFKQCGDAYIAANRAGWRNAKHAAQWVTTFNETRHGGRVFPAATEAINDLPVSAIDTGLVLKLLEPLWARTPETASRVRSRIELVLDWARVRGIPRGRKSGSLARASRTDPSEALETQAKPSRGDCVR